ncbi:act minimal PKS ketosynthase (KS/KS alpha) [Crossiella equi]|uniref:Act minimal PKS ketosynthase (KS/KS alpha) n=1 Tax=Crossiella equi TaxID=130796 RepID=A0ABS5A7W5_9PSEU|nr:beta-ketoacyl-[acyl-carrier-protein] synthase family protein [Crossiella equi]MBP2472401.1 act minimal PKS ketosynthase (KS/KS alpha) [Crossiella equi]
MPRKVVITGLGVLAPGGVGTEAFHRLLSEGRTATRALSRFDATRHRSRVAAEVDLAPEPPPEDRATRFIVAGTRQAVADSGLALSNLDPSRVGAALGGASGLAAELARAHGAPGPGTVVATGRTSGLDVLGHAARLILGGAVDVVLTGATEAPITPAMGACFDAVEATSARNDTPETACRPFDRSRDGFVLGEGAAGLVLEEYGHAARRGAHIYAELAGFGTHTDGAELAAAITAALDDARVEVSDVDYVNAHGTASRQDDLRETEAFKQALGAHAYEVPVSSIKSMIGHALGAAGALEVAACALAMAHDFIPPTANLHEPDPELDLDFVPLEAREQRSDVVLCVGSGFDGSQSALVLRRVT